MPRPTYSEDEAEAIKQELLAGALSLFRDEGMDDLSMRRLAARMDISHTKLYRYFKNKDDLLAAMRLNILSKLDAYIRESDPSHLSPRERLKNASRQLYSFASNNPDEYFFLFSQDIDDKYNAKGVFEARSSIFNFIVDIAEEAHKRGDIEMDGRTLTNLAWAMLHGLISLGIRGQLMTPKAFNQLFENGLDLLFRPKS